MWWQFRIRNGSASASINIEGSGSKILIFKDFLCPLILLVLVDWVVRSSSDERRRWRGCWWWRRRLRHIGPLAMYFQFSWWSGHIISVLVTRSCFLKGKTWLLLLSGRSVWSLIKIDWRGVGAHGLSFLIACRMLEWKSRLLMVWSPIWLSVLLLNVVALLVGVFFSSWPSNWQGCIGILLGITAGESPCLLLLRVHLRSHEAWCDTITVLQASVCSLRRDVWFWRLPEIHKHHRSSGGLFV